MARARTGFLIRRNSEEDSYCVIWRPATPFNGPTPHLRDALSAHREELVERLDAQRMLLASDEPERAERFLGDAVHVRITEVLLEAKLDDDRFADFMQRAFRVMDVREEP